MATLNRNNHLDEKSDEHVLTKQNKNKKDVEPTSNFWFHHPLNTREGREDLWRFWCALPQWNDEHQPTSVLTIKRDDKLVCPTLCEELNLAREKLRHCKTVVKLAPLTMGGDDDECNDNNNTHRTPK